MKDEYLKVPYGTIYIKVVGGTIYSVTKSMIKDGEDWIVIENLTPLEFEEDLNE
jgi:hypothetical protein